MGKKHHYVPRFYLKRFAIDRANPRQLRLFSIPSGIYVPNASLYNQCHRSRFYGRTNEIEDALSVLEGRFAAALRIIDNTGELPKRTSQEYADLLLFVGFQWMRTGRAADDLADQVDKLAKTLLSEVADRNEMEDIKDSIETVRVGYDDPVLISMARSGKMAMCIADLKTHIVEAGDGIEFVTSDHPIQPYNIYCEGVDWTGVTGAVSTGLMVFVPISPSRCLLFYDGSVYKVGKPNTGRTVVTNADDSFSINALQFVGAEGNVYCSGDMGSAYFGRLAARYQKARGTPHVVVKGFQDADDPMRSLVMNYHPMPNLRLSLSFVSVRRNARKKPMRERAQSYRMSIVPPDPFDPTETWEEAIREGIQIEHDRSRGSWVSLNLIQRSVR